MQNNRVKGFTLVELAIVLVIIGLIIGGVLVGKDMIKSAEIQASISQVEKYNAATNAFRAKYNGIPGDLQASNALAFGFTTRSGAAGHGDGNGLVEGCGAGAMVAGCENVLYWSDLSSATMINGSFVTAADDYAQLAWNDFLGDVLQALNPVSSAFAMAGPPTFAKDDVLPQSKLGRGNYLAVYTVGGANYFQITNVASTDSSGVYTLTDALTPFEAGNIDKKIDDGFPLTGSVRAVGGTGPLNVTAVAGAGNCVFNAGSPLPYNTTTLTLSNAPLCQLSMRIK